MRALIMDTDGEGMGVDIALRAQAWGHDVQYWLPPKAPPHGQGLLHKPPEWEPLMRGADLVVLTGNSTYASALAPYFAAGYPIFGTNQVAAQWELDRSVGMRVLERAGIPVARYVPVDNLDAAIDYVRRNPRGYAIKPWGGEADKAMTTVARDMNEALFALSRWKARGLKGQLMLQETIEGIEMGVSGWFSPAAGWLRAKEEDWEHKKFMNDDLGANTGEQGTVMHHVADSKLFDQILEPLTDQLYEVGYVGDCGVNCIIDEDGVPWPLEFTMRLGWPNFCIRQAVISGDPLVWMRGLLDGQDLFAPTDQVIVGIVLSHGDYPTGHDPKDTWQGFPVEYPDELPPGGQLHWQQAMLAPVSRLVEGQLITTRQISTSGNYIAVATGVGETLSEARDVALATAQSVRMPSNLMYRTDIGRKLQEQQLAALHSMGYATKVT